MRRNRVSAVLVAVSMVAITFGVFFSSWPLLSCALLYLSIYVVSLKDQPPSKLDLDMEWSREEIHLHEGDDLVLELTMENHGDSVDFLEVFMEIPPELEIKEGAVHNLLSLEHGEKKKLTLGVAVPLRGDYNISRVDVRYEDPLGVFSVREVYHRDLSIHVLPAREDMRQGRIRPRIPKNRLGNISSRTVGVGTEFFSLREYRAGDRMRDINWKATAKKLEPMTNDYEGEMSGDVILIIDGFKGSNIGSARENTFGASVRAAATLSSNILGDRNRVGLIILGERLSWIYPGYGREQYYKILAQLSTLTSGGLWQLDDVQSLLRRFFPSRCLLIIITPLTNPKVTQTVYDMTRRKHNILVISPSPLAIEKRLGGAPGAITEKMYALNRNNTMNQLWQYCPVVDWDPQEPLEVALEEVGRYLR